MHLFYELMERIHLYLSFFLMISLFSLAIIGFSEFKLAWAQGVLKTIDVGNGPLDIEYNPFNKYVYVANFYTDDVSVIG